jgi:hypothetical protein
LFFIFIQEIACFYFTFKNPDALAISQFQWLITAKSKSGKTSYIFMSTKSAVFKS